TSIAFLDSVRLGVEYQDDVFVGDFNEGNLYHFSMNAMRDGFDLVSLGLVDLVADNSTELQEVILGTGFSGITDLKVGRDGFLYLRSFGLGKIFVISGEPTAISGEPRPVDFDRDGKSDIAVYRDGVWFVRRSSDGGSQVAGWGGLAQDIPVPGDYDGDGKVDTAVYRSGAWFIKRSSDGGTTLIGWGALAQSILVPGDMYPHPH